jgi:hypothetical protein
MVSVTQSLKYVRLAGNRIFLAFTSALQDAIASLIARSSASERVGAANADVNAAPSMAVRIPALKLLVKRDIIC